MGVVMTGALALQADPVDSDPGQIQKLSQENKDLKTRLDALEAIAQKEGLLPSNKNADPPVGAMTDIMLSGFVTSSFFHDSSNPQGDHVIPGYLWNRENDTFSLNKVKLTLASPAVERSGDNWGAAFRTSFIFGQDAPIVDSGTKVSGGTANAINSSATSAISFSDIREAYVEVNVPIGTGLNIKAGELISLLNYESGDGGAANNNFSQGFQWFFTGNGPAAGVQLGYTFTDWLDLKVRVQNGLYSGPLDNNASKTYVASLGVKPMDKLWFNLIAFGGREDAGFAQSLTGGSIIGGYQMTEQLSFGTELDYFNFYNPPSVMPTGHSPVWSTGLWTSYDFTKQVGLALRTEFLSDKHGVDASGGALGLMNPPGKGQDITSAALTLNYKPVPMIKIQPEIRFDHTSYAEGWIPGKQNRVIFGAGASYLF